MLFTDGLYEVQDRKNELYSQAMLVAGVQRRAQLPVPRLFDLLLAEIKRFSADSGFADDVCLVGIEYAGSWLGGSARAANARNELRSQALARQPTAGGVLQFGLGVLPQAPRLSEPRRTVSRIPAR